MKMCALMAAAILVSESSWVLAQQDQGRTQPRAAQENVGIDRAAAVGHALCMAIEGSELWCIAHHARPEIVTAIAEQLRPGDAPDPTSALKQHARTAFESSRRLFDSVRAEEEASADRESGSAAAAPACEEFYQAARRYGAALESCCKDPGNRAGVATQPPGAGVDPARLALLNHAVKEAVGGVGLRQLIQHHDDHGAVAAALKAHAAEMIESSREALTSAGTTEVTSRESARPIIGERKAPELPKRDPGTPRSQVTGSIKSGGSDQDLSSLAKAVIDAVEKLDRQSSTQTRAAGAASSNSER